MVVGGVGGSGTRVLASILQSVGVFMGSNLNEALDNMRLAKVFNQFRDRIHALGPVGTKRNSKDEEAAAVFIRHEIRRFTEDMHVAYFAQDSQRAGWGWKVPGNLFILSYLAEMFPGMRYVHVVRHGVEMAFSPNQNQLRNWGLHFGINLDENAREQASLAFWIAANRHALSEARRLRINFMVVNFNVLCHEPQKTIGELLKFFGMPVSHICRLAHLVCPQPSLNRHAGKNLDFCGPEERAALREFGFEP